MPTDVRAAAKRLDKHYIGARYPNALPEGAPADSYTELDAEQALAEAKIVVDYVEGRIPTA